MPFHRDALAISLLLFSVIFAVWLVSGPPGFIALHQWQTLMASIVALGAASMAYAAAMAKVKLDRELNRRNEIRRDLGLCLRLSFALIVVRYEAKLLKNLIPEAFYFGKESLLIKPGQIELKEPAALLEAWSSLESFPPWIAKQLSLIRSGLYDVARYRENMGDEVWEMKFSESTPTELKDVRVAAGHVEESAKIVYVDLEKLIEDLRVY
jgi:hypothetical protein